MNYSKLKNLLAAKNIAISKAANYIGRSQNWFHTAVKNDTMTISDLEKILSLCKTTLAEFFSEETSYKAQEHLQVAAEPELQYNDASLFVIQKCMNDKDEIIKLQKDKIANLEKKVEELESSSDKKKIKGD